MSLCVCPPSSSSSSCIQMSHVTRCGSDSLSTCDGTLAAHRPRPPRARPGLSILLPLPSFSSLGSASSTPRSAILPRQHSALRLPGKPRRCLRGGSHLLPSFTRRPAAVSPPLLPLLPQLAGLCKRPPGYHDPDLAAHPLLFSVTKAADPLAVEEAACPSLDGAR